MGNSSETDEGSVSTFPEERIFGADEQGVGCEDSGFLVVDESLTVVGSAGLSDLTSEDPTGRSVEALETGGTRITDAVRESFQTGESVGFTLDFGSKSNIDALATPLPEIVVVQLRDLSPFARLYRELRRSRKILDTLDDGIYTLDEAFVITSVNDAVTEITGYSRDELVGSHASKLAGDETISMATEIIEQLRSEDSDVGLIESSIRTADGESAPIETRFSTVEFANGDKRRVGLLRDVTDKRHHEHALRKLNRSARQLLRADEKRTVCETTIEVATAVWPDAEVIVYRFDKSDSHLEPVAASGSLPEPSAPGTSEWDAFATGTSAVKRSDIPESQSEVEHIPDGEDTKPTGRVIEGSGDGKTGRQTLFASLEEHGLLTVEFGSETAPDDVIETVELLAANAVAALGRVEREAELSRRQEELAARNTRLERAREFNDLLRQINGVLVDATTLGDVATAVCDHLVGAEQITFAWFGETYRSGVGLEPVAQAGDGDGYLDDLDVLGTDQNQLPSDADTEPAGQVLVTGEPVVVHDVSTGLRDSPWRERALVRGFQSVIAVPIKYNDLTYGALSVYADRQGAFEDNLGDLLGELGGTIGNAINGLETKRSLRSQSRAELQLRVTDPDTISSRLATALDGPVSVEGIVPGDEDRVVLYVQCQTDPTPLASGVLPVEEVRSLGDDDSFRAALTVTGPTLADRLADYGADVKHLRADPESIEVTVVVPQSVDVRGLVDALEKQYSTVELLTRRDRETTGEGEFSTAVLDRLTDRQKEVVETAYLSGYFEWPRESTGEEVAETLDITQPTFNRHLRTTERNLFSLLFED